MQNHARVDAVARRWRQPDRPVGVIRLVSEHVAQTCLSGGLSRRVELIIKRRGRDEGTAGQHVLAEPLQHCSVAGTHLAESHARLQRHAARDGLDLILNVDRVDASEHVGEDQWVRDHCDRRQHRQDRGGRKAAPPGAARARWCVQYERKFSDDRKSAIGHVPLSYRTVPVT
eukprot:7333419-Prymnesium_polylepis.2